jgi:hypothetical protein
MNETPRPSSKNALADWQAPTRVWTRAAGHEQALPSWLSSPRLRRFTELWIDERRRQLGLAGPGK